MLWSDPSHLWEGASLGRVGHTCGGSRDELGVLSLGAAVAPGTHGPLLSSPGVNLLVGTENGLMLLDRSGQGKVYNLINRRRFQQMDVLEGLNVLVTISGAPLMLSPLHSTASPEWFQLRQNLLSGARGKLPGEI